MSKAEHNKKTILDNSVRNVIKLKIQQSIEGMWEFCFANKEGKANTHRSVSKTDTLHKDTAEIVTDMFGGFSDTFRQHFSFVVEKEAVDSKKTSKITKIKDIKNKKFNVDIILEKTDGSDNIHSVFLVKAPLTSLNKNLDNSANSVIGEANRFFGNPENADYQLVFINFIPKNTFVVNKKTGLTKEQVNYFGLNTVMEGGSESYLEKSVFKDSVKNNIKAITIFYDLKFKNPEYVLDNTKPFYVDLNNIKTTNELNDIITYNIQNNISFVEIGDNDIMELIEYFKVFVKKESHIPDFRAISALIGSFENSLLGQLDLFLTGDEQFEASKKPKTLLGSLENSLLDQLDLSPLGDDKGQTSRKPKI
ncbi:MAG TPA: hypothetical protein VM577_02320 [Anaerovoracaceae bacterium]|nr:hypothetical protein [Anaerovoracaceae bacterium]